MNKHWTAEEQKEHRRLWVEALRSGKYQQATQRLRNATGGFCCLGVACDISGLGQWGDYASYKVTDDDQSWAYLPAAVREWLGLNTHYASYTETLLGLSGLNDDGAPFSRIADIIESAPSGLLALSTAEEQKP